jgi:prepilin-type processing-associated H-X9-DG protein
VAQDDNYCVLLHSATGTVIELVRHSKGWLHTLYPDGHVDCPRVQVLDAEHLITQIRNGAHSQKYYLVTVVVHVLGL